MTVAIYVDGHTAFASKPAPTGGSVIRAFELNSQGYGLQLNFSDGHERGIYPWPYLAQLTPEVTEI